MISVSHQPALATNHSQRRHSANTARPAVGEIRPFHLNHSLSPLSTVATLQCLTIWKDRGEKHVETPAM